MSDKINLDSVIEIYITNQCNLTCNNCNRFNNYNFSGHYSWQKNQQAILDWGKRITAPTITIIGGEPMLHPDLYEWCHLVTTAWPDRPVTIQSNGTVQHPRSLEIKFGFRNIGASASLHHAGLTKLILKNRFYSQHSIVDNTEFTDCALIDQGTHFDVHDSDPVPAFNACAMSHSHTIFEGQLYKCPMVAVLPEFSKQYQVNLTQSQSSLLSDYQPLDPDCSPEQLMQFVNNRHCHIDQCRLCPEDHNLKKVVFHPLSKSRPKLVQ